MLKKRPIISTLTGLTMLGAAGNIGNDALRAVGNVIKTLADVADDRELGPPLPATLPEALLRLDTSTSATATGDVILRGQGDLRASHDRVEATARVVDPEQPIARFVGVWLIHSEDERSAVSFTIAPAPPSVDPRTPDKSSTS